MLPTDTLYGSRQIPCTTTTGDTATLTVRQVPFSRLPEYERLRHSRDDLALLAFLTGESPATLDALSAESIFALLDAAEEINGPLAAAWTQRQAKKDQIILERTRQEMDQLKTLSPELFEKATQRFVSQMEQAMQQATTALGKLSSPSSQTSAPAPA